jgi:hypothetical protein
MTLFDYSSWQRFTLEGNIVFVFSASVERIGKNP